MILKYAFSGGYAVTPIAWNMGVTARVVSDGAMFMTALSRRVPYQELGADYFDRIDVHTQRRRLIRRLESLGLEVSVKDLQVA
jgi:hypothetical protein